MTKQNLTSGICEQIISELSLEHLGVYAMIQNLQNRSVNAEVYNELNKANEISEKQIDIDAVIIDLIQHGYLDIKAV